MNLVHILLRLIDENAATVLSLAANLIMSCSYAVWPTFQLEGDGFIGLHVFIGSDGKRFNKPIRSQKTGKPRFS